MSNVVIHPETLKDGFTQSEINTLSTCPTKWYLRYNLRLDPPSSDFTFAIGSAWHAFKEERGKSEGKKFSKLELLFCKDANLSQDDMAYKEFVEGWLMVLAEEYNLFYKDDFTLGHYELEGVEEIADLTVNFEGVKIRLTGRIDEIGRMWKHKTIADAKTVSSFSGTTAGWDWRFQFMFYIWLQHQIQPNDKATQFMVDAARKPSIKLKGGETRFQFLNRLRNDIKADPTKYFVRERFMLTKNKLESFETNTLALQLRKLKYISDPKTPKELLELLVLERRTNECMNPITGRQCEFFNICERGATPKEFKTRTHKHSELQ